MPCGGEEERPLGQAGVLEHAKKENRGGGEVWAARDENKKGTRFQARGRGEEGPVFQGGTPKRGVEFSLQLTRRDVVLHLSQRKGKESIGNALRGAKNALEENRQGSSLL